LVVKRDVFGRVALAGDAAPRVAARWRLGAARGHQVCVHQPAVGRWHARHHAGKEASALADLQRLDVVRRPSEVKAASSPLAAEAAVGLIVTEGVGVDRPASRNEPNVPFFCGAALPHWAETAKVVKAAGGFIMPQLWHVGALRNPMAKDFAPRPVDSPSGMASPGKPFAEPMSLDAIDACIAAFGQAAADAQRLGFDGVELHGAHGYLIDQFFWGGTNERTDQWGGATLGERTRFAVALLKACRAAPMHLCFLQKQR
jgi:2,4-dienoyl-CoA reductase-like NADH-dependent reductase (Old Yellow Enzyme family)